MVAHILIGGDFEAGASVRSLLQQWGMTCGRWTGPEADPGYPTIDECDAVILVHPTAAVPFPDQGRESGTPPAPMVLLGIHPGRVLLARDAWQVVPETGPDGAELKAALTACLERTCRLRGDAARPRWDEDKQGYLHFLGHELRSPLTAAKTALEVLQGELGGMSPGDHDPGPDMENEGLRDSRLKMLDIALRNIQRLHRTVDWSQDLLEMEVALPVEQSSLIPVEKLAEAVQDVAAFQFEDEVRERLLESDLHLLRILAEQMARVLEYALPGCPLSAVFRLDPARTDCLEMRLFPAAGCRSPQGPRITRAHLASAAGSGQSSIRQELDRLRDYVVSRGLLDRLRARVTVQDGPDGMPGLVLGLELADSAGSGDRIPGEPPAVLRTSA